MKDVKALILKINQIDEELSKSKTDDFSSEIDLNDPNWQQIVEEEANAFLMKHKVTVSDVTSDLIETLKSLDVQKMQALRKALSETKQLKDYLHVNREEGTSSWFKDELALLILKDLGDDSRDALLELNYVIDQAKRHSIEVDPIIRECLKLANTDDKHGMGSMKTILGRFLN